MRRVLPFLIALTVLVPSLGHATTLYRCGGAGAVSDHCCCAPAQARHDDRSAVRKACCCETIRIAAAPRADRESPATAAPPIMPAISAPAIAIAPVRAHTIAVARPRDATAPPDPLYVLHCALLR